MSPEFNVPAIPNSYSDDALTIGKKLSDYFQQRCALLDMSEIFAIQKFALDFFGVFVDNDMRDGMWKVMTRDDVISLLTYANGGEAAIPQLSTVEGETEPVDVRNDDGEMTES